MILVFIGTTELLLLAGLALLLVGGKKLPEMMRGLGKGVKEFKEGMKEPSSMEEKENELAVAEKPSDLESPSDEQKQ